MAWLHGWAGLALGWLVYAIALSGTATVFKGELGDWMRPEIVGRAGQVEAVAAALDYLAKAAPASPDWYLSAPNARSSATIASYEAPRADGGRNYRLVALDPITGRPDGIRDTLGGEFLYRFHFELQLPYPWGRLLASAAGMMLLVTLISGIVTHRRIFADFFTLRPGKGKRSWLDAHNVLGVVAMPFHLMIALTGVLSLVALTLPWAASARYGDDMARYVAEAAPGLVAPAATGRAAPPADVRMMLRDAVSRFDGGTIGQVAVIHPGDAAAVLRVTRSDGDQLAYGAATSTYAMATGRLVSFYAEDRPAKRTYDILYGLHMGRFTPVLAHWLYFLSGLALSATIATGLILWTQSRDPARTGHRFVSRITVGIVAGMPLAIAAFLWANRLLSPTLAGRAEAEVSLFFLVLAAAVLYAVAMPPRRGWAWLMVLCGATWLMLPLASAIATGRGLFAGGALGGDRLFVAADLLFLVLGGAGIAIAVVTARHKPPAPRRRRAAA
ncbi:PepSY-associated TM helix domain-containing protein [Sphingopyxis terrae]|uniref:PepSY-associated TM helix domain-containing protein n=1 Tax=Sphingopyxis terrae TaxID=33052 RepID=UPI000787D788|nr:PepSY-associated TM helix domain-containing protein [Sphingopyxis terrae]